jgi:hypothetical protein
MSGFDIFGLWPKTPRNLTVAETVREAEVLRRPREMEIERQLKKTTKERDQTLADLRACAKTTDKTRGKPLLVKLEALNRNLQYLENIRQTNMLLVARLQTAQITEQSAQMQRINANALHRINRAVGSDRMQMPTERLNMEVQAFDALAATTFTNSDNLLDTLAGAVEPVEVTDAKWDEFVAMDAQAADIDVAPDPVADPLEDVIEGIMRQHERPVKE